MLRISAHRTRTAFTIVELLVVTAIIALLSALLFPAVMSAREAARRTHCANNLREIGLAVHEHHNAVNRLPQAWQEAADVTSGYGWAVELLSYLGETSIRQNIAENLPVDAVQNDAARNSDIEIMRCPSDISESSFYLYREMKAAGNAHAESAGSSAATSYDVAIIQLPTANYAAVYGTVEADDGFPAPPGDGPIVHGRRVCIEDLQRGQVHTILVGERTMAMVPTTWFGVDFHGEDAACRLVGSAITAPSCDFCDECEFSSRHSRGSNFAWADGHVCLVSSDIDAEAYRTLAKRQLN
jgi:prepilin-type processing-associated H-X9-DG protein